MFCSLHTHSLFCDGTCSLEEMARAAADAGLVSFGFSGHAPAVYDYAAMSDADAENYLVEIARLKKKCRPPRTVYRHGKRRSAPI